MSREKAVAFSHHELWADGVLVGPRQVSDTSTCGPAEVTSRLGLCGMGWPYLICISMLRLCRKCPEKARQSTGVSVA